jgi:integrase
MFKCSQHVSVTFSAASFQLHDPAPAPSAMPQRDVLSVDALVHDHYLPFVRHHKKSWRIDEALMRRHVLPHIGRKRAADIRETDILRLLEKVRENGLGKATEYRLIALTKHMFNMAMRWELPDISRNPVAKLKTVSLPGRERYLTESEMQRLADELTRDADRRGCDAIRLILATGARRNEVVLARWSQVTLDACTLRVPSKSGRDRSIRLNDVALALLRQLPSRGRSEYLFPGSRTGRPTSIFKTWRRVRRRAGLEDVRLHDLRHTFASILVNQNVSLYTVKELLGHSTVRMTERYAHLANRTTLEAAQLVARAISAATEDRPSRAREVPADRS